MFFVDVYYTPAQIESNVFLSIDDLDRPKDSIPVVDLKNAIIIARKYLKLGYSVFIENHE